MSLTGGKRKANNGLKSWVAFVKQVQKEEILSYKDAIHRAKVRKDKGEKWMKGGLPPPGPLLPPPRPTPRPTPGPTPRPRPRAATSESDEIVEEVSMPTISEEIEIMGGRRRRRTARKGKSRKHIKSRKSRHYQFL